MENTDIKNPNPEKALVNQELNNNIEVEAISNINETHNIDIINSSIETPEKIDKDSSSEKSKKPKAEKELSENKSDVSQTKLTNYEYDSMSREQLVILLEDNVKNIDVNSIKTEISLIKVSYLKKSKDENEIELNKFIEEGGKKEDFSPPLDSLTDRFNIAFNIYKEKKATFNDALEKQKQENLKLKLQILEDLKLLLDSEEELKKTYDAFKNLQERWKEIGLIPKTEINNLWQNYNFLVEKFFDKVKINKELKDLDLRKNLEAKIELCEKTEELLLETSINKSFSQLQKYHEMWREIGPAPFDKKDEIWERFRNASEKINERRHEHYNKIQEEQEKNIITKQALCEKAEQIAEITITSAKEWQDQTTIINDMLNAWKTIGAAPKKQNDELWIRFKTAIDAFYNIKKDFFEKLKDEQVNNYNEKVNICLQVEALTNSNDWKRTTEDIINLQKEWKKIGPVPQKYSDKIWKRFRAACDEFFNNKTSYFSNIDSKEEENLKLKLDIISQIKEYQFGTDNNENLQIIKDFQRKWMDIGHVPMKNKNEVQIEFRNIINSCLDNLNINSIEKNTISFKTKFEAIASSPGANQSIYREQSNIQSRITTMKNDIMLWENNIGFFANSKKADLLKEEFFKKIATAKEEIIVLEEKLKFLKTVK